MHRKFSFRFIILSLLALSVCGVGIVFAALSTASANKAPDFEFETEASINGYTGINGAVSWQNGSLVFKLSGGGASLTSPEIRAPQGAAQSALLSVRNTILIRLSNKTDASSMRLSFITSEDSEYDTEKSKEFSVDPDSGFASYYINLSDVKKASGYLRGFRIEPIGASSGTVEIEQVRFEREAAIYDYAGKITKCEASGDVIIIEGTVSDNYSDETVTIYESPVTNYTQSINNCTEITKVKCSGTNFTASIPFRAEDGVTRLSSLFIAAVGKQKISPWFKVENFMDFSDNPYEFTLPDRTVNVLDEPYCAKGDSFTNDDEAIQKAIDDISAQGGGRVIVPGDTSTQYGKRYIVTNIKLKDNVELYLEEGAVLWQSQRESDYKYDVIYGHDMDLPGVNWAHAASCNNMPIIQGDHASNIKITGKGIIRSADPGGENTDSVSAGSLQLNCSNKIHLVPIGLYECKNVEIRGISLKRTNNYHINLRTCTNVFVADVMMDEVSCVSGDGISTTVGTKNVVIDRCYLYTNDDSVTICSTYNDPRGIAWWHPNPDGDNCIDSVVIRHSNFYGGHGITFITWGTDNPDMSKQEIKNIEVYDNVLSGAYSVGSWGDNPYYGGPFDGTEQNDYSPVKQIRIHGNRHLSGADILPVLATDIISDCGLVSASNFIYGNFERTQGEAGWTCGFSNWSDSGDGLKKILVDRGSVEDGAKGSMACLTGKGSLYEGLHMTAGKHTLTAEVYLQSGAARLFVSDILTGEIIAEKDIPLTSYERVELPFNVDTERECYLGIELTENGTVYADNFNVTSSTVTIPKYFTNDFSDKSMIAFDLGQWQLTEENGNVFLTLPENCSGVHKLESPYTYADLELSFSVKIIKANAGDSNVGVSLCRGSGGNDQYDIHYEPSSGNWVIRRYLGGAASNLGSISHRMSLGTWYKIRVVLDKGHIQLYVDDSMILEAQDGSPLGEGIAFVCTYNNTVSFDDVTFADVGGNIGQMSEPVEEPLPECEIKGKIILSSFSWSRLSDRLSRTGILWIVAAGVVILAALVTATVYIVTKKKNK